MDIEKIYNKWNVIYAIIFAVSSGLLVDMWAGYATVTLFVVSLLLLVAPYFIKFGKYLDS